jgi:hypothetical protein
MHSILAAVMPAGLALIVCTTAFGQRGSSSHCDPLVDVQNTGPGTYKERGDRCEGEYEQKVSGGTGLRIASLTDAYPDFKFAPGDKLHLAWTADGNEMVRLRAISLRFRHYYRMDSARPAGSSSWVWPAEVLEQHAMASREIGLTGVTRHAFSDGERDVYVPVRVAKNGAPPSDKPYVLVVAPAATLQQVFMTVTPLKGDGTRADPIVEDKDLQQGPYPGQRGIRVALPPLTQPGYYSVELAGVTDAGKPVSVGLTLYHGR